MGDVRNPDGNANKELSWAITYVSSYGKIDKVAESFKNKDEVLHKPAFNSIEIRQLTLHPRIRHFLKITKLSQKSTWYYRILFIGQFRHRLLKVSVKNLKPQLLLKEECQTFLQINRTVSCEKRFS